MTADRPPNQHLTLPEVLQHAEKLRAIGETGHALVILADEILRQRTERQLRAPETIRETFEGIFMAPPYEFRMARHPAHSAWPGNYKDYKVQCAWDGFQEGVRS